MVVALSIIAVLVLGVLGWAINMVARRKTIDMIVLGEIKRRFAQPRERGIAIQPRHLFFCFVDHFEPFRGGADRPTAIERTVAWMDRYPKIADRFRDSSGRPPQHSFFYPEEEYDEECLDMLASLKSQGFGDIEIHLHHDNDTSDGFREKIDRFKRVLHERHGLLHLNEATGQVEYAFIHGNWALDDSGPKGRWCGVRDEITVLKETGCYADFTFPSAPDRTQPPMTNRIYYAVDDPVRSRSHFRGADARYGVVGDGDLLLITGPVGLNWHDRKHRVLPRIENADVSAAHPPTPARVRLWGQLGISVHGWPHWRFVKVHTHGAWPPNLSMLLDEERNPLYEYLLREYNDEKRCFLHFVTAREMYQCIKTLEHADTEAIRAIESFRYERV